MGHLSYDCPNLQVQGKLANVAKSSQMFYNKSKDASSDEYDSESFSEGEYEKDEYEEQAFMTRGQGERQEKAEARATWRKSEKDAAPAQPSASVRPLAEKVAPPRQTKRKRVFYYFAECA